jgi:hypothetical protein
VPEHKEDATPPFREGALLGVGRQLRFIDLRRTRETDFGHASNALDQGHALRRRITFSEQLFRAA